jgi:hypothetical protein
MKDKPQLPHNCLHCTLSLSLVDCNRVCPLLSTLFDSAAAESIVIVPPSIKRLNMRENVFLIRANGPCRSQENAYRFGDWETIHRLWLQQSNQIAVEESPGNGERKNKSNG